MSIRNDKVRQSDPLLARLPADLWDTPYVGSRFPGSSAVDDSSGLAAGANCQLFAYEVLRLFGFHPAPLRSRELWADTDLTERVSAARPLDLVLFNATSDPWGAHVGAYAG